MSTLKAWLAGSVFLLLSSQSFAQSTLACWYNASGNYTGADGYIGAVGSITRTGSGDYAARYLISAFNGTACPRILPAAATKGITVFLVKKDFSSCANDDVVADSSNVGGAVTVFYIPNGLTKVVVRLGNGDPGSTTPDTTYHFRQKCLTTLGDVTTDGYGDGAGAFDLALPLGEPVAFDVYPEGDPAGNTYQSVQMTWGAFGQSTVSCRYNSSGDFLGGVWDQGPVGSITSTASGAYRYLISGFSATACPGTIPTGALKGKTRYLVKGDVVACSNADVVAKSSNVGGSVTVFDMGSSPAKVVVRLGNGTPGSTAPNTSYSFDQKCVTTLGSITTDDAGKGGAAFDLSLAPGEYATFEMAGEVNPVGNRYQSAPMTF